MNRIVLSAIVSALMLSGCGSSSSNGGDNNQGFYVDSAVEGVHYKCDNGKEGTTGADGAFVFTDANECTFSLAGIKLRTVSGANLKDGTKVLEENPVIAQLLQSLDGNGNPDKGGIVINEEAFKKALVKLGIDDGELPTEDELKKILEKVAEIDKDFKGKFVTKEQAMIHVGQTAVGIAVGQMGTSTKASSIAKIRELYIKAKIEKLFGDAKEDGLNSIFHDKTCQSGTITNDHKQIDEHWDSSLLTSKKCKNGEWELNGKVYGSNNEPSKEEEHNIISAEVDTTLTGPYGIEFKISKGTFANNNNISNHKEDTESESMVAKGIFTINDIDIFVTDLTIEKERNKNTTTFTLASASLSIGNYSFKENPNQVNIITEKRDKDNKKSFTGTFYLIDGAGQSVELTLKQSSKDNDSLIIKIDENGDGKFSKAETLEIELP